MQETLENKLSKLLEEHFKETGVRVTNIDISWVYFHGDFSEIAKTTMTTEKGYSL